MVKLVLPVLISLFLSMLYSIKFINTHKLATIFSLATVINIVCLFLGTVYFWVTVPDGIAQGIQSVIYAVCFVGILLINVITVIVAKKRGIGNS
ncbi:MAG: hypothetical protein WD469_10345 [Paenibacillaceae bacterium]